MGAPKPPRPVRPPKPADTAKAELNALAYADMEKRLRRSTGRKSMFHTAGDKSLLGQ